MEIPDIRMWPKDSAKTPVCEECGEEIAAPIMTSRAGDPGNNWTHDRLPNGEGCWFYQCPECRHRNYFDLDGETSISK